jgi:predicted nucleic acid-binding protein
VSNNKEEAMNHVEYIINTLGRAKVMSACCVNEKTTYNWQKKGAIPRKYQPLLEKLARDAKCFGAYKSAFLYSERAHKEAKK